MIYQPPFFLFNAHLETIFPALLRNVAIPTYVRERIDTPDDDFLDLDWLKQGSQQLVVISHGLEGNTERAYVKGMAKVFADAGYDVLAWNFRGCSGEMNRQLRFYHSGATDDLQHVLAHAQDQGYQKAILIGFSLGGNLTLKFLGEKQPPSFVHKAIVFSVPLHLHSSCSKISMPSNTVYAQRFLRSLKDKIRRKAATDSRLEVAGLDKIATLIAFDDRYTAPLHGFEHAADYYKKCSSLYFLEGINVPTLIVNAANDPFLSPACYPAEALKHHRYITFEQPNRGGHVGFAQFNKNGLYWSEERALRFAHTNDRELPSP